MPRPSDGRRRRPQVDHAQEALIYHAFAASRGPSSSRSSFLRHQWTQANVPAIVHMAHSSQEEGNALADVLFGDVNPGGRLVTTWPRRIDQLPPLMDYDLRHGRIYMYFRDTPLYPFGHGLSYTSFDYANLSTSASRLPLDGEVTVTVATCCGPCETNSPPSMAM
jgi:beta-glucosidase